MTDQRVVFRQNVNDTMDLVRNSSLGTGNSMYKVPKVGRSMADLRKNKDSEVSEGEMGRM